LLKFSIIILLQELINQAQIQRTEARYRASGKGLAWREKYKLHHKLNQSSHNIRHQKYDKQAYQYPKRKL